MSKDHIYIRGARHNNLKNLDLDLPLGEFTVITGVSGSGKSSLAFDTIYAEGQRRYVETFSPYARQFLDRMDRPQVDEVAGIPPAIAIDQTNPVRTSRSTVGTMTELNDHLKLLYARAAQLYCQGCGQPVAADSAQAAAERLLEEAPENCRLAVCFDVTVPDNFSEAEIRQHLSAQGYERTLDTAANAGSDTLTVVADRLKLRASNRARLVESLEAALLRGAEHASAWVLDDDNQPLRDWQFSAGRHCADCDISYREPSPAMFSFNSPIGACGECRGFGRVMGIDYGLVVPNTALSLREGAIKVFQSETNAICQRDLLKYGKREKFPLDTPWRELSVAQRQWVIEGEGDFESNCWYGVQRFFGWLEGRSYKMHVRVMLSRYRSYTACGACDGARLVPESLAWRIGGQSAQQTLSTEQRFQPQGHNSDSRALPGLCLHDVLQLPIEKLLGFVEALELSAHAHEVAEQLLEDIVTRLRYLNTAGVGYLSLDRQSRTLSGGEVQRINLTTALGTSLVNTLFVLDEPSIGLHPRDLDRITAILQRLRDAGNTLLVVEHDPQLMLAADRIIDMGPGPGARGGEIVFNGSPRQLLRSKKSRTADFLVGRARIETGRTLSRPAGDCQWLTITGAREHNLKNIDVRFPLGHLSCVTGVSGSGKSTLIHEVLYRGLLRRQGKSTETPGACEQISGWETISQVMLVDQSAIGKSARSNPASYTGAFDKIRAHFATLPLSKERDYTAGSFSFNSKQQKCPGCGGSGHEHVEMQFLSDVYLRCPDCQGRRYRDELLEVHDLGADGINRNIADVLALTVEQALAHFDAQPKVLRALQTLCDVGLDYVTLGQPVPTLSGGEAQRLKLAAHLVSAKRDEPSLFLFDEPTTGLHFEDISRLMAALRALQDAGHTLIIIEHNLEVIAAADWLIDLGPEGGEGGGEVLVTGTQQDLIDEARSHTGRALAAQTGALQAVAEAPAAYQVKRKVPDNAILVSKANEHNLKNIDVRIPRDKLVVVTGVSGSGKSTLAFDIVFAEGQRRYLESLNAYARQFVQPVSPPDVDHVAGIPPTVAIEQRTSRGGQKSTVGTATEIHHFLRLLFVKLGTQHCPDCDIPIESQSQEAIAAQLLKQYRGKKATFFAPLVIARKGYYTDLAKWANNKGIAELRVDGEMLSTEDWPRLDRYSEHNIDMPVAELLVDPAQHQTLDTTLEKALGFGNGTVRIKVGRQEKLYSTARACGSCQTSFAELDPRLFSYNSRHGWCKQCFGTGLTLPESKEEHASEEHAWMHQPESKEPCAACAGQRLNPIALAVRFHSLSLSTFAAMSVAEAEKWFDKIKLQGREQQIARDIVVELSARLAFLCQVGLGYLSLDRAAPTLSGGEAQRIRLAAQLGSQLRGVAYVLDEPTIGLHPRDNDLLLDTLVSLRDKGNTVIVVEHDDATIRRADHIIDIGPGAGSRGGELVATGTVAQICKAPHSQTGRMLAQPMQHPMPRDTVEPCGEIRISGARLHNLQDIDITLPLGQLLGVSGVSGSGKSTLVREIVSHNVSTRIGTLKKRGRKDNFYGCESISGFESLTRVLEVDQTPIGKTPRSCPATYVGIWDAIRKLFAATTEASIRGYAASRFSFNTGAGRCPVCEGQGMTRVEMNFLPDVKVLCDGCNGDRFDRETLSILWRGKNIGEVLNMAVDEAVAFFEAHPAVHHALRLMQDVGLGYLTLGQNSPTLSGGEAQRLKLVTELAKAKPTRDNPDGRRSKHNHTLYLLDEPTVGLHMADVEKLIRVLHRLVSAGHSVIVIEHNLDLLAECDWLIDMGPEGGARGGKLVVAGPPPKVAKSKRSLTGQYLKELLG